MRQFIYCMLFLGIAVPFSGCKKDSKPEDAFIKIYDDQNGNKHFHPLGITTSESNDGYIVVSAYDGWRIQLMKIDNTGEFVWNYELPSNYVNAVPNLIKMNGQNYLVCMDPIGLFTYVLKIDETAHTTTEISSFSDVLYPTAAYNSGQTIYIQNYDRLSYKTGIHQLSGDMTAIEQSGSVNIFTDVEERIVNHVTYNGNRIPFFVSSTPEQDYIVMNGFYNYSFSLIFLNPDLSFAGVYNGAGFNGGLSALSPLGASRFALARFSYDNLYYNPGVTLNPTAIDIAESIPAQGISELAAEKPVLIRAVSISDTEYKVYVSSTRSNQLLLSVYDPATGELVGKKYLGKNVPITACDLIQTEDKGLNILVQVKIMGNLDRIGLIKLSKAEAEGIVD